MWVARAPNRDEFRGKTQAEAIAKRDAAKPAGPLTTVKEWCTRWLKAVDRRPQTQDTYEGTVRTHIVPQLGSRPVAQLSAFDVEEAVRIWGAVVSAGTVHRILGVLSAAMQTAVRAQLIDRNPVKIVNRPKRETKPLDIFTADERAVIIDTAATRPAWRPFVVCAAMGLRIGEALALAPGDYDPVAGTLTISKSRTRSHGIGKPKSQNGERTISVPAAARAALAAGVPNGHYSYALIHWKRILETCGLRYRNPHQLRHTVASLLVAHGAPLADAARYIGDTFDTFVRTYCHPVGIDPVTTLDALYGGHKVALAASKPALVQQNKGIPDGAG